MKNAKKSTKVTITTTLATALMLSTVFANAQHNNKVLSTSPNTHTGYAKVVKATPLYKTVEHRIPHQACWVERVKEELTRPQRHSHNNSTTSTLVGGIVGGAIGNAVGHSNTNKKIGVVVGSLLGMSIGNDIGRRHQAANQQHRQVNVSYRDVERCETQYTVETEQELRGYQVTYVYQGQRYSTQTRKHPGKRIKVAVSINPVF